MYDVGCVVSVSAFSGIRYMVPKNGGWRDHGVGAQMSLQDLNSSVKG
jgi:hypothetical protein